MQHALKPEALAELAALDGRQRALVLGGLRAKLDHYGRTGRLSYAYAVCPVCQDMGSTEEAPRCAACYIQHACQAPFVDGFRDDVEAGVTYFRGMLRVLERLQRSGPLLFVGGSYDSGGGSGFGATAQRIADALGATEAVTGGTLDALEHARRAAHNFDVTVWMPSVHNEEPKAYPRKRPGSILICAKVMRPGYTRFDSVSRIFHMGANAVIEVHRYEPRGYRFALVDALGNEWVHTADLHEFAAGLDRFLLWAQSVERIASVRRDDVEATTPPADLPVLVDIVRAVADRVENERGGRYFGNASTRCMAMFPSARGDDHVFVSARNVDKQRLAPEDFVCAMLGGDADLGPVVIYSGERKPSVDTPVQLKLYQRFSWLRYMIHGHAFLENAPTTEAYFPCGDLREAPVAGHLIALLAQRGSHEGAINLKNHGFLLYADTLEALMRVVGAARFRNVVPAPGAGTKGGTDGQE